MASACPGLPRSLPVPALVVRSCAAPLVIGRGRYISNAAPRVGVSCGVTVNVGAINPPPRLRLRVTLFHLPVTLFRRRVTLFRPA
jgi:hypothetical protein